MTESGHFTSTCHPCESGDLMRLLTTLVPYGTACWRRLWLPVKRGMTEKYGRSTPSLSLRGGFANEAISCRLPRPIGLAMTGECGRSTPTCHPWTSVSEIRGSTGRGPNVLRCAQYAQSGRSMVEMLGVLAVMGILSAAGIAGYNNAMNRHRANELLNEASKRATVVAATTLCVNR